MRTLRAFLLIFLTLSACTPVRPEVPPTLPPTETPAQTSPSTLAPTITAQPTVTPPPTPVPFDQNLSEIGYILPLTVQHNSETRATLLFELDTPTPGVLLAWTGEEPQTIIVLDGGQSRYQITLDDLLPGTTYQAVVGLSTDSGFFQQPNFLGGEWGPVQFRTPSGETPIRFGVIGDSGFGEANTLRLTEQMAAQDLDFVVHVGDVVYLMSQNASPVEAFALKYYATFSPLLHLMPVYPVVGNHDVQADTRWQGSPFYYYAFPAFPSPGFEPSTFEERSQWYAFSYGEFQFLMLDSQTFFSEPGRSEQQAWLEARLADTRFKYTIPVFHVPPYSSGPHHGDGLPVAQSWASLFDPAKVPLVFSGHEHVFEHLLVNGIDYFISGGGSSALYDQETSHPDSLNFASRMNFLVVTIYADQIEVQAFGLDGEIFDTVVITLE
jgi:predicted phosphodiesterase